MADNEYMFHRVGALGHEADWLAADAIPYEARLHLEGGEWAVREGEAEMQRYPFGRGALVRAVESILLSR